MMLTTLLLAALGAQNDPAALYREGLYEEIDLGRLDLAVEIYGKVIGSSADKSLQARALYRKGYSLEKLGRKKDAEQAYREVVERYASETGAVELARARLQGKEAPAALPLTSQIQQLILDLGSPLQVERERASHKLRLLGAVSIPELKQALAHKDATLSAGAAEVLFELEQYDGLYDAFFRSIGNGWLNFCPTFAGLLIVREAERKRFVVDARKMKPVCVFEIVKGSNLLNEDPEMRRVLNEIVGTLDGAQAFCNRWLRGGNISDLSLTDIKLVLEVLESNQCPPDVKDFLTLSAAAGMLQARDKSKSEEEKRLFDQVFQHAIEMIKRPAGMNRDRAELLRFVLNHISPESKELDLVLDAAIPYGVAVQREDLRGHIVSAHLRLLKKEGRNELPGFNVLIEGVRNLSATERTKALEEIKGLIRSSKHRELLIRQFSGWASEYPELADVMAEALSDPDREIRSGATIYLVNSKTRSISHLIEALKDPENNNRSRVIDVLGSLGALEAFEPLMELLSDPDVNIQHGARAALQKIKKHHELIQKEQQEKEEWRKWYEEIKPRK